MATVTGFVVGVLAVAGCVDNGHVAVSGVPVSPEANARVTSLVAADLDADGLPDLVFTQAGRVRVLHNASTIGSMAFAEPLDLMVPGRDGGQVVVADMDGDGHLDLVVADRVSLPETDEVTIFLGPGFDQRFELLLDGSNLGAIAVGDLDGDGRPDLVAGGADHAVTFILNTTPPGGELSFAAGVDDDSFVVPVVNDPFVLADLDGDGALDVLLQSRDPTSGYMTIPIAFGPLAAATSPPSFRQRTVVTTETPTINPQSIVVADFTGDGKPDLAVATIISTSSPVISFTDTITIFAQTPAIAAIPQFSPTRLDGYDTQALAAADLDGDGLPELIVASNGLAHRPARPSTVTTLRNRTEQGASQPVFAMEPSVGVELELPEHPGVLAIADVDGDGVLDIIVAHDRVYVVPGA